MTRKAREVMAKGGMQFDLTERVECLEEQNDRSSQQQLIRPRRRRLRRWWTTGGWRRNSHMSR